MLLCIIRSAAMRIYAVLLSVVFPYIEINKDGRRNRLSRPTEKIRLSEGK